MSADTKVPNGFDTFELDERIHRALEESGYETPTPIQAATIPLLLDGRDVIGQAQTGTGKTAAFALPALERLDPEQRHCQVLVLAPTRELAMQVAESFEQYARHLSQVNIAAVYGGAGYAPQIRAIRRGAHVIVGTPGRVMDHMRNGVLDLGHIACLVLDEADEMLRMGFVEDVEWILSHVPAGHQTALFSATMPPPIQRIAQNYLTNPERVQIQTRQTTADTICQRYLLVPGYLKYETLARVLEAEVTDGVIVFTKTRLATIEVAEQLQAAGLAAAPLNGDMPQTNRERTVQRLKDGHLDILVATDVAARGLDIERVSHVINYDMPNDTEAYIHRIGRTGRAGRTGHAILLLTNRERRMLSNIERRTRQTIKEMQQPSAEAINQNRMLRFKQQLAERLANGDLDFFVQLLSDFQQETDAPPIQIAAALASIAQGDKPLLIDELPVRKQRERRNEADSPRGKHRDRMRRNRHEGMAPRPPKSDGSPADSTTSHEEGMHRYRIEVGRIHGVRPGNIVGAIAGEANIDGHEIGRIDIRHDHSLVDLPSGIDPTALAALKKAVVSGRELRISPASEHKESHGGQKRRFNRDRTGKPPRGKRPFGKSGSKPFKGKSFKGKKKRPRSEKRS